MTTNNPDSGLLPRWLIDIAHSDQYWYIDISRSRGYTAWHNGQPRVLQWDLDESAGNTFGCQVSRTGELHFHHNWKDMGVVWEGLPTDQPLWELMEICGWTVEANYFIPKGEAVWCDVYLSQHSYVLVSLLVLFTSHGMTIV